MHGVPDTPVDVYVDGKRAIDDFQPGTSQGPVELPSGSHQVALFAADAADGSGTPVLSASADLPAGGNVTLVAHLDASGNPKITPFVNDVSSVPAGQARLVVRHTAAAPAVDVLAGDKPVVQGLSNGDQKALEVPAGSVSAAVAAAGTTEPVIGPADLDLKEGTATFVQAIGKLDGGKLELVAFTVSDLHGSPSGVPSGAPSGAPADGDVPAWLLVSSLAGAGDRCGVGDPPARGRSALTRAVQNTRARRARGDGPARSPAWSRASRSWSGRRACGGRRRNPVPAAPAPRRRRCSRSPSRFADRGGARRAGAARARPASRARGGRPVTPVGVDDRGRMDVPFDIRTVGWYRFGPGPGATTGSAVLSGHVDDRDQGYGAFHRLGRPRARRPGRGRSRGRRRGVLPGGRPSPGSPKGELPVDDSFRAHRSAPAYAGDVRRAVRRRRTCVHGERGGGCAAGR